MFQQRTILLIDKVFQPLKTISRKKALKLEYLKKGSFLFPDVLQLLEYINHNRYKVSFSKRAVFHRDDYTCQYCGKQISRNRVTIDHVLPVSRGGYSTFKNCVTSCLKCNMHKASRTPEEARMPLLRKPWEPSNFDLLKENEKQLVLRLEEFLKTLIN